jgi:hypothetical protein
MTDLELIRRAQRSPGNQDERQEEGSASTDGKLENVVGGLTVLAWLVALDHFGLLERLAGHAAHLDFHGVVVSERNRHALPALSPDVDVVLIWGSGHVRGLAAGQPKAGYRRQAIQWVRVGRVPPLWTSAMALWSGLRSSGGDNANARPPGRLSRRPFLEQIAFEDVLGDLGAAPEG